MGRCEASLAERGIVTILVLYELKSFRQGDVSLKR